MLRFNSDEFLSAEFQDGAVLFSLRTHESYIVNKTGFAVLRLCDGKMRKTDIVGIIAEKYAVDVKKVREDVDGIIIKYKNLHILKGR